MTTDSFVGWVADQLHCGTEELASIWLDEAFAILVCRIEDAARRGVVDPLAVVRNSTSGGNSRVATRRMLEKLGYRPAQLRVVHRLLGGSPGGWPGLLSLFVDQRNLTSDDRVYVRRQLREIDGLGGQDRSGPIAS